MNKALESYSPRLRKGMIAPSGKMFVYKVDGDQIELPFAMADLVLLCDGQNSLYQILVKMHQKQGVVHFQKVIDTLLLLFESGFIENEEEIKPLVLSLRRLVSGSSNLRERFSHFLSDFSRSHPGKEVFLRENIKNRIERNSFFSELSEEDLDLILNECEVILFSKGQVVIRQNEIPDDIYLLMEGQCEATGENFSGIIQRGSFFGEGALIKGAYRAASVRASRACQILRIPVSALIKIALTDSQFESLRRQIIVSQFFGSSPHFQDTHEDTIERLQRAGQLEIVNSEHVVFEDGDRTTGLYFLVRGSVRVEVSDEKVVVLSQGEMFGEISVIAKLPRTAKVVTREPCFLFKVSLEAFWEVLLSDLTFAYRIEKLCELRLAEDLEILQRKTIKAG